MKIFGSTGITGKAGEYYFAYWIVRHFQWPCRILDIDVGIDAQVEVFEDGISTGNFFAVQIKSTIGNKLNISIKLSDFEYWQQIENNVILVYVVLSKDGNETKIYWKYFSNDEINKIIKNAKNRGYDSKLIKFSHSDKLEFDSKKSWLDSLLSESDKKLIGIAALLIEKIESYNFNNFVEEDYYEQDVNKDYHTFIDEIEDINGMFHYYENLKEATKYDERLKIRAKGINDAIVIFESHKNILLLMFHHAFDWIKEERMPEEILPRSLSKEIRSQTEDWLALFTSN
ncbi:DUF4365 domain-containing protein [Acinetobacter baumannii]|nr:DUF4365 domain-containing protein [Acinetobacter baumannii]EMC7949348.1 DUF4365 domain-containing protein [Acinetobacter baumannii]EMD9691607.1 DUF4365 domain-containing protein [Acinetobacter baumannii]